MKYTNNHKLSKEIAAAIIKRMQKYSAGGADYSATEIIDSPQVVRLKKEYSEEITVDVYDLLDAWQGHLIHDALEEEETSGRLHVKIADWTISGAWDRFEKGVLKDYKRTSVWTYVYESMYKKYEQQLNIYAFLLRTHGQDVDKAYIEFFFKDWSEYQMMRSKDYPRKAQMRKEFPIWTYEEQNKFIRQRLDMHIFEKDMKCTSEEMWEKSTVWALMKSGRKSAVKLFDSPEELHQYALSNDAATGTGSSDFVLNKTFYIQKRAGERTRCERFCDVKGFCPQYKEYIVSKTCKEEEDVEH